MKNRAVQKTIRRPVVLSGKGIHSGKTAAVTLIPSLPDSGIVFCRTDLNRDIPCSAANVSNLRRCVGLSSGCASVDTVEHLLAGLMMTAVTNIRLEVDSGELPFLDGAAYGFVKAVRQAGTVEQEGTVRFLEPSEPLTVRDGGDLIMAIPSDRTIVSCAVNFPHPMLKNRFFTLDLDRDDPVRTVSKARTFGFEKDIRALHECGLGLGGDLDNTLVFTETGVANRTMRYPDEAVRHKVLDFLGDMYLAGRPLRGVYILYRNGHRLDAAFLNALLAQKQGSAG